MPLHQNMFHTENILVMAHRGGAGLFPENTLYAFERAVAMGADVLEMDIHQTRDGELVVIHDAAVDRTTNGSGLVKNMTLAELKKLCAGYHWSPDNGESFPFRDRGLEIPTLSEVFEAFPNISMNIDMKQAKPSIAEPFCELIRQHQKIEQVLAGSFHSRTIRKFRRICPEVSTAAAKLEIRLFCGLNRLGLARFYSPRALAFQVPEYGGTLRIVTLKFVKAAHKLHKKVHVWTVNHVKDMARLSDMGVDGIITDYPNRLIPIVRYPFAAV